MVDAGKSKGNKSPESKINIKPAWMPEIDMMSLIVGAAIYAFFPILAYDRGIDALIAFGAAGPLLIGYQARSDIKAIILGIIGGTPLLYLANLGYLGAYKATETSDLLSQLVDWFGKDFRILEVLNKTLSTCSSQEDDNSIQLNTSSFFIF